MSEKQSKAHSLRRTSPKGGPFIGVCVLCGCEMALEDMWKTECENVRGLRPDEAVIDAIRDKP